MNLVKKSLNFYKSGFTCFLPYRSKSSKYFRTLSVYEGQRTTTLHSSFSKMSSLSGKKFVLIDLSGTLHVEDDMTPHARESLEALRNHGFVVLFVTNTTKESKRKLFERLKRLSFNMELHELFTSMDATKMHIQNNCLRPLLLLADEAKEDFEDVDQTDPNCVVVGLSPNDFNYETLSSAMRLVINKDARIISVHKGRRYLSKSGMNMGPGCFVVALENATTRVAEICGKPEQKFFEAALEHVNCIDPTQAVMIGDDVRDDVEGAMKAGMTGMLVKTGKYISGDENKISPNRPDFVCENFAQAVEFLLKDAKKNLGDG